MNTCQVKKTVMPVAKTNLVQKQYNNVFGKKEVYTENEVFVFNAIRNAQKILERYED
ncbi:MAG: hypothetical protein LBU83_13460 [Bacteroidales bacterium]|jgi:hypothetical protein|nr:hypothetical protein [Bacteroidales bacterium]